jgi:CheY-like chemotaxis protein
MVATGSLTSSPSMKTEQKVDMRIAYVEDNPTNFSLVERVARMAQHTVVSYTEGEIALTALKVEVFDLILMDVELAGEMTGLDLVHELRKDGLQTPIIAVTAYAMLGDREKCIEAGCNEYLPKPLPITDLISTFARYNELTKNKAAASTPEASTPARVATPPPAASPTPIAPTSAVPPKPVVPTPPEVPAPTTVSKPPDAVTSAPAAQPPSRNSEPISVKTDNIVDN